MKNLVRGPGMPVLFAGANNLSLLIIIIEYPLKKRIFKAISEFPNAINIGFPKDDRI